MAHTRLFAFKHFITDKESFRIDENGTRWGDTPNFFMDAGSEDRAEFIVRACNTYYEREKRIGDLEQILNWCLKAFQTQTATDINNAQNAINNYSQKYFNAHMALERPAKAEAI